MQQRKLGRNGPQVSAIGLGCLSFGGIFGATEDATSLACLDAAQEAGITFLDTANVYGQGRSETVIGQWIKSRRPKVAIATKAAFVDGPPRRVDNSEAHLRTELEASLRRLNRDHVELFYLHRREQDRPLEDAIGTLSRLIEEGKIGGYGLSEVAPETLRRAHLIHPCTAVQNEYSLWSRQPELGLIRACADLGVAFVPFSPLARGMLGDAPLPQPTDAFRSTMPRFIEPNFTANTQRLNLFRAFCQARGWSTPATALAWVLSRGPHLIPIPGSRHADHVTQFAKAANMTLSPQDLAEIDQILPPGFAAGDRYGDHHLLAVERYC